MPARTRRFPIAYDAFKALVALLLLLAILWFVPRDNPPEVEVVVDPGGAVTLSGSAPRGAGVEIEVWRQGRLVDRFRAPADDLGRWVVARTYPPGRYQLVARLDRSRPVRLELEVPEPAALEPIEMDPLPDHPPAPLVLRGRAEPGEALVVYLDGEPRCETLADLEGRWSCELDAPAGGHTIQVAYRRAREVTGAPVGVVVAPPSPQPASAEDAPAPPEPQPTPEPAREAGRAYVVQEGDWLSKLAARFLGDPERYGEIREATNRRADEDPSFARIEDDDRIYPGEKIWIPAP